MTGDRVRKFVTRCLAIAALFGIYFVATLGVTSLVLGGTATTALARGGGGRGGGGRGGGRGGGGRGGWVGRGGGRGVARGAGRGRFWHGRWWGYGSGPCWRWTAGGWVWICN